MTLPSPKNPQSLRIPILPVDKIVDEQGMPTKSESSFRQALIDSLQKYMGNEGLVAPNQSSTDLTTIQNNNIPNSASPSGVQYTCQLGTIIYVIPDPNDYTQDKVMIAVRNSNDYPASAPLFKTITLT